MTTHAIDTSAFHLAIVVRDLQKSVHALPGALLADRPAAVRESGGLSGHFTCRSNHVSKQKRSVHGSNKHGQVTCHQHAEGHDV